MERTYKLSDLIFEWDEAKYSLNLRNHGVTFEEAAEVFFDSENVFGDASRTDESESM